MQMKWGWGGKKSQKLCGRLMSMLPNRTLFGAVLPSIQGTKCALQREVSTDNRRHNYRHVSVILKYRDRLKCWLEVAIIFQAIESGKQQQTWGPLLSPTLVDELGAHR